MDDATSRTNQLPEEASPYLRRQAGQPVHWLPWGEQALRRAADEDRPLLVSIGYAASHQCRAADTFFDDPDLAELVNSEFVGVKVDRLEHPEVDSHISEMV